MLNFVLCISLFLHPSILDLTSLDATCNCKLTLNLGPQVLAVLYKVQGRLDLALAIYLQLHHPGVFDFVRDNGLYSSLRHKVSKFKFKFSIFNFQKQCYILTF